MNNILEETEFGRDLARRKLEQGREEGRQEGRQEGRDETRRAFMSALLKHNYGPIPDLQELAHRLVADNHEQHLEWVMDCVPLERLRSI
jgi:predicted transposase YdaD